MARREITADFYSALVDAFRQTPGNAHAVANAVAADPRAHGSCNRRTASRAWTHGWPRLGLRPIRGILDDERSAARELIDGFSDAGAAPPLVANPRAIDRERVRAEAVEARALEALVVRRARDNVLGVLACTNQLLEGFRRISPKILEALPSGSATDIHPTEATQILWRLASAAKAATTAGLTVLQMERLLLGQPPELAERAAVDDMTESDVVAELEAAGEAAKRIKARRALREALLAELREGPPVPVRALEHAPPVSGHGPVVPP